MKLNFFLTSGRQHQVVIGEGVDPETLMTRLGIRELFTQKEVVLTSKDRSMIFWMDTVEMMHVKAEANTDFKIGVPGIDERRMVDHKEFMMLRKKLAGAIEQSGEFKLHNEFVMRFSFVSGRQIFVYQTGQSLSKMEVRINLHTLVISPNTPVLATDGGLIMMNGKNVETVEFWPHLNMDMKHWITDEIRPYIAKDGSRTLGGTYVRDQ